jgi:acyl-CoA synthetase (AMP-forming)/AMP-acid ligase II
VTLWNYADVWESIADAQPDAPAQIHGPDTWTWAEFDRRADGVAAALLAGGAAEQDKVAQYLYNGPEYVESMFGAFKAGLAVVNTNYRYTADEIVYLWDNADVVAVVFHGAFAATCEAVRDRLPRVTTWLWVDDGSGPCPEWATPYEAAAASAPGRVVAPWGRSGEHLLLLYTGGTTGMPKGVMWRQHDLIGALETSNGREMPDASVPTAFADRITKPGPLNLPAAPLMHGTGLFNALGVLVIGGSIVTLTGRRFDPIELLDTVQHRRVKSMTIVGDAFAKPILAALDAEPDRWDLSSLRVLLSSGVMWSKENKAGLLRHVERLIMVDSLGSSEAIGLAASTTTAGGDQSEAAAGTASFKLSSSARVVDETGRDVAWGTGERGLVAMRGYLPLGYYKDPDKSASTFKVIDGERYTIPGDWATVDADGTVRLLGRGSQCINTGGEKVYPEEVEEVLKQHPSVFDAAVVGVPDDRFGETIAALVQPSSGVSLSADELIDHVKAHLAGYKAPRRVITVESVNRAPNGKLDYKSLKQIALETSS